MNDPVPAATNDPVPAATNDPAPAAANDRVPTAIDLDRWLADPAVQTHHRREAASDPAALWAAAQTVRLVDSGLLGRVIRWRVPGTRAEQTYREMFTSYPFLALEEGEQHLLAGLCGRIWSARPTLARLGTAADFETWAEPGTVRVLFAQWAEPSRAGAVLISETRVAPVDARARLRLRGLWPLIGRFQGLIGTEPLRVAVRRAQEGGAAADSTRRTPP